MSSTYLQLVNKVLRQLNEVELDSSTFSTTTSGAHVAAIDAVQYAVNKINSYYFKWPFNFQEDTSQLLVVGQELYSLPSDFSAIDWDSFYVVKDTSLSINTRRLMYLDRKLYNRYFKELDYDTTTTGRGIPDYVFSWYNTKFGITPSPTVAYTVKYNYWSVPTQLSLYSDTVTFDPEWDYVAVLGAMEYMHLFKENSEASDRTKSVFEDALKKMRTILINEDRDITDTVNNFGQRAYTMAYPTATGYILS